MANSGKITHACLYIADKRPVLMFEDEHHAKEFQKGFSGAEIYSHKTHVYLPTPDGLLFVRGGAEGEMGFVFHDHKQANDWLSKLKDYGLMYSEGEAAKRTVFLGRDGKHNIEYPIFPSIA